MGCKLLQLFWKIFWHYLEKLKTHRPHNPAIPLISIYTLMLYVYKNIRKRVVCKREKLREKIHLKWIKPHSYKTPWWMDIPNVILSERRKTERDTNSVILYIWNLKTDKINLIALIILEVILLFISSRS